MPNFRFLGFNAGLLMRPQERSKQESLLLDSGGSPSRKIASLSEAPTSLAAGWLEVSACSTPRPPASSTPITIGSNSRHSTLGTSGAESESERDFPAAHSEDWSNPINGCDPARSNKATRPASGRFHDTLKSLQPSTIS
ncbi:hypothetical protein PCANC_03940 [Puccinia coronata f. sp. avenae]|uniref:Uncharacterized protein n=1 Tax=Puccinia coronata f. sp. avenae TaxID=200324 RepID=A0A2N5SSB6_9BASI|nr:hypothetical protein PCANC_17180 [Puccinia coronata f. sp. avenae]PLW56059.1 hypothetical protein PCANC_03940 [Puccinia coronata f. sp. avenae]